MPTLLHLDSSADLTASVSRDLTARFAAAWLALGADHLVVHRDLHKDPLPPLETSELHWPPHLRTRPEEVPAAADARQQAVIAELLAADVLLVGAPMYNWSVPPTLKAWIDHVHVPAVTAPFGDDTAPLAGRPAVVVSSRGGKYAGTPDAGADHCAPLMQQVLGTALAAARADLDRLARELGN